MVVDSSDDYAVPAADEKEPVAIINPDSLDADGDQPENVTLATDCMFLPSIVLSVHGKSSGQRLTGVAVETMKELVLPPLLEEPRILDDAVDTWTIENWRNLSKREHGPVFQAGGFPWSV